jgi:hypothetical protein
MNRLKAEPARDRSTPGSKPGPPQGGSGPDQPMINPHQAQDLTCSGPGRAVVTPSGRVPAILV